MKINYFFAFNLGSNHRFHRSSFPPFRNDSLVPVSVINTFIFDSHFLSLLRQAFKCPYDVHHSFPYHWVIELCRFEVISVNEQTCHINHKSYPLNILLVLLHFFFKLHFFFINTHFFQLKNDKQFVFALRT